MSHGGDAREIPGGTRPEAVARAVEALRDRLDGRGPALVPRGPHSPASGVPHPVPDDALLRAPDGDLLRAPDGATVLLATSGSTGAPRLVALGATALVASARATHAALAGPGRWLLALGIEHVAGWQVLVRSVVAGSEPVVLDTTAGFDPAHLPAAVERLGPHGPRYTALVPTQLVRALRDPAATTALAGLDAVLVGGAALADDARSRALAAGIRVVTTYGATETSGGCVYDGTPLPGVQVTTDTDARLWVAGPTLALGYVTRDGRLVDRTPDDGARFVVRDGRRLLRTTDLGSIGPDGRVRVLARADDVIVTGGVKVHPAPVERVLARHPDVGEVVVVGVPDADWGRAVIALVVPAVAGGPVDRAALRRLVAEHLPARHAPRAVVVVPALPVTRSGKVDRSRAAALAAGILAGPRSAVGGER